MHPTELRNLEQRLENQLPIIGGCLRQRTAKALARDGSPDAVRVLAKAIARSDDRQVLAIALDALRQVTTQQCIDEVCAVWSITRHKDLAKLLAKKDWVASAPVEIKVLSALKAGKLEAVTKGRAEIVEPLLKAFNDTDSEIASRASQCAIALTNPDAIDYLCEKWSKTRDKLLERVILQGKYVAQRPIEVRVLSGLKIGKRQTLASDGVEMIAPLLQACTSNDPKIATEATELLNELKNQSTIDSLCNEWAKNRTKRLTEALQRGQYVATNPPEVRVLSALKVGRLEAVVNGGVETVELLLQACGDADAEVAKAGQSALRKLKNLEAQEALCKLVIEQDHQLAREVAVACQYTPRVSTQQALWLFLTEQWDKYESLDFENTLLQTSYQAGDEQLRQRITQKIRQAGRAEWIKVLVGKHQEKQIGKMTDTEWDTALRLLNIGMNWEQMWQLAQAAPPIWSTRLLQQLKDRGWVPNTEFTKLVEMAQTCAADVFPKSEWRCETILHGHSGCVRRIAISPDSKLLAINSDGDKTVNLWSLPDGKLLQTLSGHSDRVSCLAISPDGKLLASGSDDKTVNLWSLPDGKLLQTLSGHSDRVNCLAISPDGKLLASGSNDKTVNLWSLPDGKLLQTLSKNLLISSSVHKLAISPDGRLLVSDGDKILRLWSLPDGKLLQTLSGNSNWVSCLAISPDGNLLAGGTQDNAVKHLWSLPDGKLLQTFTEFGQGISCLAISPDSKLLVSSSCLYNHTIRLYSLPDGKLLQTLSGHRRIVNSLAISPDSKLLASGSDDKTVRLWSLPDGKLLQTLNGHSNRVHYLAISPDGKLLVSSSYDKTVKLWMSNLDYLIRLPVGKISMEDMRWVQEKLQDKTISEAEQNWLKFIQTLVHWHQRFNIEVEEAPQKFDAGEFDIEVEA